MSNVQPVALSQASGLRSFDLVDLYGGDSVAPGTVLMHNEGAWSVYDGTHPAAAVLSENTPWVVRNWWGPKPADAPSGSVKVGVIARDAELSRSRLVGLDTAAETALLALGLVVREL